MKIVHEKVPAGKVRGGVFDKIYPLFCCMLLLMLVFAGCGAEEVPYNSVNTEIVAAVNGTLISCDALISRAAQYGDEQQDEEFWRDLLNSEIDERIKMQRAQAMGFCELSEEEQAEIRESVAGEIAERREYYLAQMQEQFPDATDQELESYTDNAVAAYVAESGETEEVLTEQYTDALIFEKLYDSVTADVQVTEEELAARYAQYVEEDKATYSEHPEYFESDKTTNAVYYNLGGYRYVKHILISSYETAQEVRERLENEEFDALMEEYTEDAASLEYPFGFAVGENSTLYIDGFADAALALEQPGDISEIIRLEDGFHILQYIREIPEGPEDFSLMRDYIESDLVNEKGAVFYADALDAWREDADIDIFESVLTTLFDSEADRVSS